MDDKPAEPAKAPVNATLGDQAMKDLWNWNFTAHEPTAASTKALLGLASTAKAMAAALIQLVPNSRERSLALTHLESMLGAAQNGILRNQKQPNQNESDKTNG